MISAAADLSEFLSASVAVSGAVGVVSFGDSVAEYRALRESAGVIWRADQRAYRIGGADRVDFLQRLLTANIKGIAAGTCGTTLLLDNKGRTQLALELGATEDELVAVGTTARLDAGMESLSRYVLRSQVEITPLDGVVLALIGPTVEALIRAAVFDTLETPPMVFRGVWGWQLVTTAPVGVWQRTLAAGGVPVGRDAGERLRIAQRRAASASEITGAEFPQELRLGPAIDFEKGCYLGQETVARIHYRGQVNRLLCVLESNDTIQVGETLLVDGKKVGRVTSATGAPSFGVIALALVSRDYSDVGTALTTSSGVGAAVVEAIAGH
jgi:folate-binding protein YgfZ